ncbi:hypothetical protein BU24DRAFT_431844 [Aaosphaeria arxii CBS 175.79]|uniref:Gag1-like clamp domain-containing protein n=1 Tax=Aaosphaeria arxii CBS 175.79 TaxID=1450172 RepID=A0A6A5XU98_9PLEO|nr:uncharacterized protein BU24DRAFT_431844 [Aaosphaeria arxii CBS 175.79]KAF2016935.1 hypothetical protein BU24DRAFT_431844 [Aaosphaeria arxii CBS 175.79]
MDNTNLTAQRAARRFLMERVRNDWSWPDVPESWSASDEEVRGVTEFRERFYGDSATESDHEAAKDSTSPYQFDSPDDVGDALELKDRDRKRRRRAALEQEMTWNPGLAQFVERRDAWTGAASVKKYGTHRPAKNLREQSDNPQPILPSPDAHPAVPSSNNEPFEPLIPVAPRMLADNHIRAAITPKSYPDIYNKIVVTSRTPAVPVNLADMTKALVVGWKEAGEWPPKATPLDPLVGRKKAVDAAAEGPFLSHHPHMKKGMESVKRIFHLNGHHNNHDALSNHG